MEGDIREVDFKSPICGGIHNVNNSSNDSEYEQLARFAVDDYNKKQNALLEFEKVVKVKEQAVAGCMYYITLEAKDGGKKKLYETQIWVKVWEKFQEVQVFKPVEETPSSS